MNGALPGGPDETAPSVEGEFSGGFSGDIIAPSSGEPVGAGGCPLFGNPVCTDVAEAVVKTVTSVGRVGVTGILGRIVAMVFVFVAGLPVVDADAGLPVVDPDTRFTVVAGFTVVDADAGFTVVEFDTGFTLVDAFGGITVVDTDTGFIVVTAVFVANDLSRVDVFDTVVVVFPGEVVVSFVTFLVVVCGLTTVGRDS